MGSPNVKVTDKGLANYNKAINDLANMHSEVGFWGNAREDDGARVVDVAMWNEYGTEEAPPRPFMRRAADTGAEVVFAAALSVARQVIAGRSDARTMLSVASGSFRDHIKATIRNAKSWAKPNKPLTIARKGHDMPLLDSHLMIATVRFRLKNGKAPGANNTGGSGGSSSGSNSGATVRGGGQYV